MLLPVGSDNIVVDELLAVVSVAVVRSGGGGGRGAESIVCTTRAVNGGADTSPKVPDTLEIASCRSEP